VSRQHGAAVAPLEPAPRGDTGLARHLPPIFEYIRPPPQRLSLGRGRSHAHRCRFGAGPTIKAPFVSTKTYTHSSPPQKPSRESGASRARIASRTPTTFRRWLQSRPSGRPSIRWCDAAHWAAGQAYPKSAGSSRRQGLRGSRPAARSPLRLHSCPELKAPTLRFHSVHEN